MQYGEKNFEKSRKLAFLYKIRIQESQKDISTEFHRNSTILYIFRNFGELYCNDHFRLKNFDPKFEFSNTLNSIISRFI